MAKSDISPAVAEYARAQMRAWRDAEPGRTQEALALALGMTPGHVSQVLKGAGVGMSTILRLCRLLDVPIGDFLAAGERYPVPPPPADRTSLAAHHDWPEVSAAVIAQHPELGERWVAHVGRISDAFGWPDRLDVPFIATLASAHKLIEERRALARRDESGEIPITKRRAKK